jgi:beta-lactamase class A
MPSTQLAELQYPEWRPLYERVDAELQVRLEQRLNANPQWRRLIQRRQLGVALVDLGFGEQPPRFARVNGNRMMYAASLPKIAILLSAYASFEDGSLAETPETHADLQAMIRVSSNSAATRMIDAVGMQKIEQVMRDPAFGFYDEARGGGLWVGKRYASSGTRRGDPLFNLSHGATVTQVSRFYYQLATGRLINEERSEQMLADLADPGIHHKFVAAIEKREPRAKIFRKSGTWRNWHADSVLVRGPNWRNYILVALVESPDGETILRELVPAAEDLLQPASTAARAAAGQQAPLP